MTISLDRGVAAVNTAESTRAVILTIFTVEVAWVSRTIEVSHTVAAGVSRLAVNEVGLVVLSLKIHSCTYLVFSVFWFWVVNTFDLQVFDLNNCTCDCTQVPTHVVANVVTPVKSLARLRDVDSGVFPLRSFFNHIAVVNRAASSDWRIENLKEFETSFALVVERQCSGITKYNTILFGLNVRVATIKGLECVNTSFLVIRALNLIGCCFFKLDIQCRSTEA